MGEHVGEDGRWLSYSELAQARGIRRATAIRITRRNRWRKQTGNDGTVRVLVPEDWEARSPVRREAVSEAVSPADEAVPPAVLEADPEDLFREISALRVELVAAGQRADQAMALADKTLAMLADAQARGDQAIERERAWWSMPRWRRLRDAWRGA